MAVSTIPTPGIIVNAPKLPTIPAPTTVTTGATAGVKTGGFDFGGLIDTLSGLVGKYIDYNTAKINGGTGQVVYSTVPATSTGSTIGGIDFSSPIVLGVIAFAIYFITKK